MSDTRYPIGRYEPPTEVNAAARQGFIEQIEQAPAALAAAVDGLDDGQLDTPYREGGWTPRQVVHHVADSHINAYVRFKLALTEPNPTIRPYDQPAWARLPDASRAPVDLSLDILTPLHRRWVEMLRSIDEAGWERTFQHPELGTVALPWNLGLYAWHGRHHTAHITALREKMGW